MTSKSYDFISEHQNSTSEDAENSVNSRSEDIENNNLNINNDKYCDEQEVYRKNLISRISKFIIENGSSNTSDSGIQNEMSIKTKFDDIATDLAIYQLQYVQGYAKFASSFGITYKNLQHWADAPAIPTDVFKYISTSSFLEHEVVKVFKTSGTTQGLRGIHKFKTLSLYELCAVESFKKYVLIDRNPLPICSITPDPMIFEDSSLSFMVKVFIDYFKQENNSYFFVDEKGLKLAELIKYIDDMIKRNQPFIMIGTAFAIWELLNNISNYPKKLPVGSIVIQTGGFKGRIKEVEKKDFFEMIHKVLNIPYSLCVTEYSMTELSSQCYSSYLFNNYNKKFDYNNSKKSFDNDYLVSPPWLRLNILTEDNKVSSKGFGLVRFFDLANIDSISSIQTSDTALMSEQSFELLGRVAGSENRGCSLAIEELLDSKNNL